MLLLSSLLSLANPDGVIVIDSLRPGPTIGVVAITHGNEPVGLKVFDHLLREYDIEKRILRGKLYLILDNIDAYRENQRFLVRDMNRIWSETGIWSEYTRMDVIRPYLDACNHVLDLHSTSSPSVPMAIDVDNSLSRSTLLSILDVDYVIRGIMPHMSGETLVAYHERLHPGSQSLVIECGAHTENGTDIRAIENTLRFLSYFWTIEYTYIQDIHPIILSVHECVHARGVWIVEYFYTDAPRSFEIIPPCTHVAVCAWIDIYSPDRETYILMPTPRALYIWEEIMYFVGRVH